MLVRRKEIAEMYQEGLTDLSWLKLPPHTDGRVWQDYIIQLGSTEYRNELFDYLMANGCEVMKNNYPFPVPKLPLAQKYEDNTLRLPCNENITNKEVKDVIKLIKQFK